MKFLRYRGVCIECKSACAANGGKRYFAVSRHFLCGEPRPEGGIPEGLSLGAKPPELFPAGKRRADKSQRREAKQAGFSQHSRANTRARRRHSCPYRASPYRRPDWRTGASPLPGGRGTNFKFEPWQFRLWQSYRIRRILPER